MPYAQALFWSNTLISLHSMLLMRMSLPCVMIAAFVLGLGAQSPRDQNRNKHFFVRCNDQWFVIDAAPIIKWSPACNARAAG